MAEKYTLTVGKTIGDRIEENRDILGNLSALFREAVEEKLRKHEEFMRRVEEEVDDIKAIAKRLKQERLGTETDFREQGKHDAIAWAKTASYPAIAYALEFEPYKSGTPWNDPMLGPELTKAVKRDQALAALIVAEPQHMLLRLWVRGWTEGVREFWKEIEKVME